MRAVECDHVVELTEGGLGDPKTGVKPDDAGLVEFNTDGGLP